MTVYDIYAQTIRPLSAGERLQIAKLILNDILLTEEALSETPPERESAVRDQSHLEELLLAGLHSGPGIEATPEYWQQKRTALLERYAQRTHKS